MPAERGPLWLSGCMRRSTKSPVKNIKKVSGLYTNGSTVVNTHTLEKAMDKKTLVDALLTKNLDSVTDLKCRHRCRCW